MSVQLNEGGYGQLLLRSVKYSTFINTFHITIYNGPANALVCITTLIQMSHTKTFQITPTCFDHQMVIIRELSDAG
jgi:hypothetical protein